jgi:hypothetical protein
MESSFKLNGVTIKRPSEFNIERYNVTNLARLADGTMTGDLIAKKRKFAFNYDHIESKDLNVILETIWDVPELFFTLEYVESNTVKTATVYSGAIPSKLHRTGSIWVWTDVSFDLIEQ